MNLCLLLFNRNQNQAYEKDERHAILIVCIQITLISDQTIQFYTLSTNIKAMQSIFVFLVVLGKNTLKRKYEIDHLFTGCMITVRSDQCYTCSNFDNGCNDPFNANSMGTQQTATLPAGGACLVRLRNKDFLFKFCHLNVRHDFLFLIILEIKNRRLR